MSIILNPALISNLNQLRQIPVCICKFIIDQTIQSIICSTDGVNESLLSRIIQTETKAQCNWKTSIKSLKFLIKYALKNQYPPKNIGIFITEKTLLPAEFAEYLCAKYAELITKKIEAPRQAKLQQISWAAYNLKQSRNKQLVNKMYIKTYTRTLENGQQQEKIINFQLPQFRYLLSQISQVNANMK